MLTLLRSNQTPPEPAYPDTPFWENPEDGPFLQPAWLWEENSHPWGFTHGLLCRAFNAARCCGWRPAGTGQAPDWVDKVVREFYGELRKLGPGRLAEDTAGVREADVIRWTGCYTTAQGGFIEPEDGRACAAALTEFAQLWRSGKHLKVEGRVDRRTWWWELPNDPNRKWWDVTGAGVVARGEGMVTPEWFEFLAAVLRRGRLQIDWFNGPRWMVVRTKGGELVRAPNTRQVWADVTARKLAFVDFAAHG